MSTASAPTPTTAGPAAASASSPTPDARDRPTPLAWLTLIELRKTVDTRAGLWLLVALTAVAVLVAVAVVATGDASDRRFEVAFQVAGFPIGVLLPIIAILAVTSEWSQRTALTTFALVPDRLRVVAAKLGAIAALAVAATLLALVAAAIGTLLGPVLGGDDATWSLRALAVPEAFMFQLLPLLMAAAFALLILRSAPAIVAFLVVPTLWAIALAAIPGLDEVARWLDPDTTFSALADDGASAREWARIGVSALAWIALPLVAGIVRLRRSEVR